MAPAYRVELIPRWVWVLLVICVVLLLFTVFSIAAAQSQQQIVLLGGKVQTGNPADYVTQPTPTAPPPTTTTTPPTQPGAAPQPSPGPTPSPAPSPAPASTPTPANIPAGLPTTFDFQGQTYQFSGGPVTVNVLTTGQYADNHIIYRRSGDNPPYKTLYVESAPNSNKFYKYTPAPS